MGALLDRPPSQHIRDVILTFEDPVERLLVQSEGEFAELADVETIRIHKNPDQILRVLRAPQRKGK